MLANSAQSKKNKGSLTGALCNVLFPQKRFIGGRGGSVKQCDLTTIRLVFYYLFSGNGKLNRANYWRKSISNSVRCIKD